MVPHPLKLVIIGYGAAVCVAAGVLASGGGWIAAAIGFWLSGPVFVLAIGATPPLSGAFQRRDGALEGLWDDPAPGTAGAAGVWLTDAATAASDSLPRDTLRPEDRAALTGPTMTDLAGGDLAGGARGEDHAETGGIAAAESLRWDRDLADERNGADLAAWDRDRLAERAEAEACDGTDERSFADGRERGAALPDRPGEAAASPAGQGIAGTGTG